MRSEYDFKDMPQPVRELLIGLVRQVRDPRAANLHYRLVNHCEWTTPTFQSPENLRAAYELVHSWEGGVHAVALAARRFQNQSQRCVS
jgi:hypothetical protein